MQEDLIGAAQMVKQFFDETCAVICEICAGVYREI